MGILGKLSGIAYVFIYQTSLLERFIVMFKMSDFCILLAVMVAFGVSGYLWFNGQKDEGVFTAIWVPSILGFGIYFRLMALKGQNHE
jgi:hypothetical protein